MSRKKHPLPIFEKAEIVDAGSEGKAVARVGELVVFVPYVVPGDIVDIQVLKKKQSYCEGRALKFHHYSEKRVEARCEHFGLCGGCSWQQMDYTQQLFYKQKQVRDAFERIGKFNFPEILPIIASDLQYYYRNKLEFTFSNRRWIEEGMQARELTNLDLRGLGFHLPQMFDRILDLRNCYLQPEPSNSIRMEVREFALKSGMEFYDTRMNTGFLRNLIVRNTSTGQVMVIVVFGEDRQKDIQTLMDHIARVFPQLTSLYYLVNTKTNDTYTDLKPEIHSGRAFIEERMEDLIFRVGPMSFYQVNVPQAYKMYCLVRGAAELTGNETVYDLYTGTGTIANFIARNAAKVIGIESIEAAVEDARKNSEINHIDNTLFVCGDIAKVLNAGFISQYGAADVIVTDPPRAGMHKDVVKQILEAGPLKLVYVSCNPATQARDLALLSDKYLVQKIQPLDMFPQTQHVENVVVMKKLL